MKLNKWILPAIMSVLMLNSCDDGKMEWGRPDNYGDVDISEIPLELAEKLANYDYIKAYAEKYVPDMTIGVGLGADLYISEEAYRKVADDNFQMITTGNAMKHSSVVSNSGAFNFTTIDNFFAAVPSDMKVYGHTFIWHTQQRASYLNSLIAPTIIVEPDGGIENIIDNSDFENGSIAGWGAWSSAGCKAEISAQGEGYNSDYAMKLTNPVAGDNYSAQAYYTLPTMTWEVGETYVYSAYVFCAEGNSSFQVQLQNRSSYSGDGYQSESIPAGQWFFFEKEFEMTQAIVDKNPTHLTIDFGAAAGITFIDNIQFGKKAAEDPMENIFQNSDFEDGTKNPWGSWGGNSPTSGVSAQGEGYESDYAMILTNPVDGNFWDAQAAYTLSSYLEPNVTYMIQFWAKSNTPAGKLQTQYQNGTSYGSQGGYNTYDVGTTWTLYQYEFSTTNDDVDRILMNFGEVGGEYYIDNIKFGKKKEVTRAAVTRGVTIVEKTDEEKKEIITNAMEAWISGMMEHCKDRIKMWDVLNEPVADNLQLRGVEYIPSEVGDQEFYWGQYMGKEYAVKAFQFARQYGNAGDKLFINDYNLEVNPGKLAKLIEYVNYIDQTNGSPIVDGIGTQMHLIIDITREQIDAMFKTMAATGKLIRVTELDVRIESGSPESQISPTAAQFEKQAQVYQWVAESYKENVPAAQQSGITIWSLTDHAREHEYWLKNDAPNLFNKDYVRKHAYKGFCDGLAGYDISTDFNGSDWRDAYPTE